ncbi:MAG: DNA translocase FtsK 4TM domain-containing protein [Anaerolineales bacterium]|nr:DNA translocase FtsK 4TM domain-containing protein [Anaerolineales bacterium]
MSGNPFGTRKTDPEDKDKEEKSGEEKSSSSPFASKSGSSPFNKGSLLNKIDDKDKKDDKPPERPATGTFNKPFGGGSTGSFGKPAEKQEDKPSSPFGGNKPSSPFGGGGNKSESKPTERPTSGGFNTPSKPPQSGTFNTPKPAGQTGTFNKPSSPYGQKDDPPKREESKPGSGLLNRSPFGGNKADDKKSEPAKKDDKPSGGGGFFNRSASGGSKPEEKKSEPFKKDDKPSGGGGFFNRSASGGSKPEEKKSEPFKKDDKPSGGGGFFNRSASGGSKPEEKKSEPVKKDDKPSGGGLFGRFGGGKKDEKKDEKSGFKTSAPSLKTPVPTPGGKPAEKKEESPARGGFFGGLTNRGKAPEPAKKDDPKATGTASKLPPSSSGSSSTGKSSAAASSIAPKAPALSNLINRFRRGGAKPNEAATAADRKALIGTAKGSTTAPQARLDNKQAKPLDKTGTQVTVRRRGLSLDQKLDAVGYAMMATAVIIFFGLIQPQDGTMPDVLAKIAGGLFGYARYVIPLPLMAVGAWLLVRHFKDNPFLEFDLKQLTGLIVLFITVVITIHAVVLLNTEVYSWEELDQSSTALVDAMQGGGWVGHFLYGALIRIASEYGLWVVLAGFLVGSLMVTFEVSFKEISDTVKNSAVIWRRRYRGMADRRRVWVENRRVKTHLRQNERAVRLAAKQQAQQQALVASQAQLQAQQTQQQAIPAAASLVTAAPSSGATARRTATEGTDGKTAIPKIAPALATAATAARSTGTAPAVRMTGSAPTVADEPPLPPPLKPTPIGARSKPALIEPDLEPPMPAAVKPTPMSAPMGAKSTPFGKAKTAVTDETVATPSLEMAKVELPTEVEKTVPVVESKAEAKANEPPKSAFGGKFGAAPATGGKPSGLFSNAPTTDDKAEKSAETQSALETTAALNEAAKVESKPAPASVGRPGGMFGKPAEAKLSPKEDSAAVKAEASATPTPPPTLPTERLAGVGKPPPTPGEKPASSPFGTKAPFGAKPATGAFNKPTESAADAPKTAAPPTTQADVKPAEKSAGKGEEKHAPFGKPAATASSPASSPFGAKAPFGSKPASGTFGKPAEASTPAMNTVPPGESSAAKDDAPPADMKPPTPKPGVFPTRQTATIPSPFAKPAPKPTGETPKVVPLPVDEDEDTTYEPFDDVDAADDDLYDEVDDLPPGGDKLQPLVIANPSPIQAAAAPPPTRRTSTAGWDVPTYAELLESGTQQRIQEEVLRGQAKLIEETLNAFGAPGRVVAVNPGPVITQFGVEPDYLTSRQGKKTRIKVNAIAKLDADLALALAARSIRIEAPVPGKGYVGIEVPNPEASLVGLRDIMASQAFNKINSRLRIALGKSIDGTPIVADLTQMPHMLIAGTTGSGKSVCVNAVIASLLIENAPDELQFIMVDPKRVELTGYNGIPHLISPVVVDLERIVGVLKWVTREMDDRYKRFSAISARNITDYNGKIDAGERKMPYLVVIIDELADLMMLAPDETEKVLTRLAQMARATGIHLILSTQRPSVDVVTGLIKANFPARISFAVASGVDSRVILDQPGAEKLLGRGDMLYQAPDAPAPLRVQGVYVSDKEINQITKYWRDAATAFKGVKPSIPLTSFETNDRATSGNGGGAPRFGGGAFGSGNPSSRPVTTPTDKAFFNAIREPEAPDESDLTDVEEHYKQAVTLFNDTRKISVSILQRRLKIGFNRAIKVIDLMKQRGVLGVNDPTSDEPEEGK